MLYILIYIVLKKIYINIINCFKKETGYIYYDNIDNIKYI